MTRVAPLVAHVEPIPGETLMSLVARAAHANVFPKFAELLRHAGIKGHPAFAPFTALDHAEPLAELLGVPLDEVVQRFHPLHPDPSIKGAVVWAGTRMRRRSIEARRRRVAPLALKTSAHHRLEWTHRALSFCPYTFHHLISACPSCAKPLGWVATKGLDRCEHCEASLVDAPAPMVPSNLHQRLTGPIGLLSPDPAVRARSLEALPEPFQAWDPGDLFSALCELGVAWLRPEEGRGSPTARALMDGSYTFTPADIAHGYALLQQWPHRSSQLFERLAEKAPTKPRGDVFSPIHLGVLGRHLAADQVGTPLQKLLTETVAQEFDRRRGLKDEAAAKRLKLDVTLVRSIGLVEACGPFEISRPVLKRLVPNGRALIAARSRREGGVRFGVQELERTIHAYNSSASFGVVAQRLGVPRYCLHAFIRAGLLEPAEHPDVALMFGSPAVTARSFSSLRQRFNDTSPASHFTGTLGAHLRRRFDPSVWAEAFRLTLSRDLPICYGYDDQYDRRRHVVDATLIDGEELYEHLPEDRLQNCPRDAALTAQEAGRLLGLPSPHLPELIAIGAVPAERDGRRWRLTLGGVMEFHRRYVTSSKYTQRLEFSSFPGMRMSEPDYPGSLSTRHFQLWPRDLLEHGRPWPRDPFR